MKLNRWKSRVAAMSVGVVAMTGLVTLGGGAVTAAPAQAYTDYNCYNKVITDAYGRISYPVLYYKSCWRDYNWWEESWLGGLHKDGWT